MVNSRLPDISFRDVLRLLGVVAALLTISTLASERAEALSPVHPGNSTGGKAVANAMTIEVRGGHGGGGGGSRGGGSFGGGRSFSGGAVRGGTFSAGVAAPAAVAAGSHFAGQGFGHRHRFGRGFVGGVYYDDPYGYPYYDDPSAYPEAVDPGYVEPGYVEPGVVYHRVVAAPGCRLVVTVYGPRLRCYHRAARQHRVYRRPYHRKHHRA